MPVPDPGSASPPDRYPCPGFSYHRPMILSDRDIRTRLEAGDLVIDPLDDPELQIQPASVDLRLDADFVVYRLPPVPCIDPRDVESVQGYTETVTVADGDAFILHPGEFALGSTRERIASRSTAMILPTRAACLTTGCAPSTRTARA